MPNRVKSFFEMHKEGINLFLVAMNVLTFQVPECKDVVCCAVEKSQLEIQL